MFQRHKYCSAGPGGRAGKVASIGNSDIASPWSVGNPRAGAADGAKLGGWRKVIVDEVNLANS